MGLDVYKLMKEGKSTLEINELIQTELDAAAAKVEEERIAAEAEAKKQEAIKDAREAAIAAMTEYFTLVNPAVDKDMCGAVLNTLDNIQITVSTSRTDGKSRKIARLNHGWVDHIFNW